MAAVTKEPEERSGRVLGRASPSDLAPQFDALRGVAILAVFASHLAVFWSTRGGGSLPLFGPNVLDLLVYGYLGVPLFFLLSGFLLTTTEESRKTGYSLRRYAVRRLLRLAPAYWLVGIPFALLVRPLPEDPVGEILWHASFLHGLSPRSYYTLDPAFWSLTPEVVFYLLLPLIVLKTGVKGRLVLLAASLLVAFGTMAWVSTWARGDGLPVVETGGFWYAWFLPTTHLYLFFVGVVLATTKMTPKPRVALALSATSVVFLLAFPWAAAKQADAIRSPLALLAAAGVVLFFASVLLGSPILRPLLKPLRLVGTVSYSLFLLNQGVLALVSGPLLRFFGATGWASFLAYALVAGGAALVLSTASYLLVERPFLKMKPG